MGKTWDTKQIKGIYRGEDGSLYVYTARFEFFEKIIFRTRDEWAQK